MDWLAEEAQRAGPFIAVFMFVVGGFVIKILWDQLLFERKEHRTAEKEFTAAAVRMAKAIERVAARKR